MRRGDLRTAVVCDDDEVRTWAEAPGGGGDLDAGTRPQRRGRGRDRPPGAARHRAGGRRPRRPAPRHRPHVAGRHRRRHLRPRPAPRRHQRAVRARRRRLRARLRGRQLPGPPRRGGAARPRRRGSCPTPRSAGTSTCRPTWTCPPTSTRRPTWPASCALVNRVAEPADARRGAWPSAPTPTTWSSAAAPPWPSGRPPARWSTTSSAPTAPRAAGIPTTDAAALVVTRQAEQRAAARALGATGQCVFLDWVDGELDSGVRQRWEVAYWIRKLQPTVVLGHDPWKRYRLHPDHRHAGFLAVDGHRGGARPALLPRAGAPPPPTGGAAALRGRRARPRRGRRRLRRRQAGRAARPHAASSCPPWASTARRRPSEVERQRAAFDERTLAKLAEHGRLEGVAQGEAFKLIDDL